MQLALHIFMQLVKTVFLFRRMNIFCTRIVSCECAGTYETLLLTLSYFFNRNGFSGQEVFTTGMGITLAQSYNRITYNYTTLQQSLAYLLLGLYALTDNTVLACHS